MDDTALQESMEQPYEQKQRRMIDFEIVPKLYKWAVRVAKKTQDPNFILRADDLLHDIYGILLNQEHFLPRLWLHKPKAYARTASLIAISVTARRTTTTLKLCSSTLCATGAVLRGTSITGSCSSNKTTFKYPQKYESRNHWPPRVCRRNLCRWNRNVARSRYRHPIPRTC